MEEGKMGGPELGSSLIKHLAATKKITRDRALRALIKTWLPTQTTLSDDDMKKLWKGLFYCVWHADKLPVQSDLINRLSSLLLRLDFELALRYFSVFLLTMRREWAGIDSLRLDKFYLLMRRVLHNFFALMEKMCWDLALLSRSVAVLEEGTFFADDKFQGNGVNYHIASVFLDELKPFLPVRREVIEVLFKPLLLSMKTVPDKVLLGKVKSNVFDILLKLGKELLEFRKSGEVVDSSDEITLFGTIALEIGFSAKLYELGSSPECCQGNRKMLLALHEEFLKLEKDLDLLGDAKLLPDTNGQDEDVPLLIPIAGEEEMIVSESTVGAASDSNVSVGKVLKTHKVKKIPGGSSKKAKKTKTTTTDIVCRNALVDANEDLAVITNGGNSNGEEIFDESVISNLQMQFEKVATEAGLQNDVSMTHESPSVSVSGIVSKKRKRAKSVEKQRVQSVELSNQVGDEGTRNADGEEKNAKKVRFSMKNNLVWKPHCPLPPQSLRLPPSVTPRGSALKKGVPPGPIREMPMIKKVKRRVSSTKKMQKGSRSIAPAIKRPKKLKTRISM